MKEKVLVADDDANITDVCRRYLEREGYQVLTASEGLEALASWSRENPDMIVLDLMMPQKNGWQVCEEIRNTTDVPIMMLTARGEEQDRLLGLTLGADDYLTKPFSPRELVLRVKAILRRVQQKSTVNEPQSQQKIVFDDLSILLKQRRVKVSDRTIDLTATEFEMLYLLASHPGQVFSRGQILNKLWDFSFEGDMTTVTVHIRRLREKIEANPSEPKYIKTVWGVGYKFEGESQS